VNTMDLELKRETFTNNAGRTRENDEADAARAQQFQLAIAGFKNTVKSANPVERVKAYQGSLKSVTAAGNALKGTTRGPDGTPTPYFTPQQMTAIEQNASQIDADADPINKAQQLIAEAAQQGVPNAALVADYLLSRANAAYLRQQAFPQKGAPVAAGANIAPLQIGGKKLAPLPIGLPWNSQQFPYGQNGGSNAAPRPTPSR
jgi:hypothetical protein